MIQSGGLLGRLFDPLLKTVLPLMKSVINPLAEIVLISLELTVATSAADAGKHKKILGSGNNNNTILIIPNDEMIKITLINIIKIVKSLVDSDLLLKGVSETVQNEVREKNGGFRSMLLGTLDGSLLGNILAGKGINRAGEGAIAKRQGRRVIIRADYGNKREDHKNKIDF